jgi:hypothetical protein
MKQLFEYLNNLLTNVADPALNNYLGNISAESITLLFLFLFSGWVFCPFLALLAKIAELSRQKTLYNNLARQFTQAGLVASLPTLLAVLILCGIYSYISDWHNLLYKGTISFAPTPEFALHLSAAAFVSLLLLQSFTLFLWKKQRKNHPIQFLLLAFNALAAFFAVFLLGYAIFIPKVTTLSAMVLTSILLASSALAVVWSGCWFLIRRNKDDFGRDYYNFALRCCVCIALSLGLPCSIILIIQASNSALTLAGAVIQVVCCILWFCMARSAAPLQHKAALWVSLPIWAVSLIVILLPVLLP